MDLPSESTCCFFKCSKSELLVAATGPRIRSIITASQQRGDHIHLDLEKRLVDNTALTITVHKSCVSTYTSRTHISRTLKKRGIEHLNRSKSEPPPRRRRSQLQEFDFKENCIICGEACLPPDPKHPNRWRKVTQVLTAERVGQQSFKEHLLQKCDERGDEISDQVRIRLAGASADLHASDAQYHRDCCQTFCSMKNIKYVQSKTQTSQCIKDDAFDAVIEEMNRDKSCMWTTVELYDLYTTRNPQHELGRRQVVSNLLDYFGDDILEMKIKGCASLICFRQYVPHKLCKVQDDSDDNVEKLTKKILKEVKEIAKPKDYLLNQFMKEHSIQATSPTLLELICKLISSGEVTRPSLSIAQSIQSRISKSTTPTTLGLGVKLHHKFGSKELVNLLHDYGYTCSYDEVLRFKVSAAKFIGEQDYTKQLGLKKDSNPISHWYDNYDLRVYTPNGLKECHGMAVEHMQQFDDNEEECNNINIPRLSNTEIKEVHLSELSAVQFEHYAGIKNPIPPRSTCETSIGKMHTSPAESVTQALEEDLAWLAEVATEDSCIEWSGSMTRAARATKTPCKATKYVFGPLIDATPSHPDTILTTLMLIEKFVHEHGHKYLHVAADMQLYRVTMMIKWSDPLRWKQLIVRPGGMHTVMSFIGCIGTLMQGSGLEELLNAAFKGVGNMLNGKAWPKAIRGLRMVVTCILETFIKEGNISVTALEDVLCSRRTTPTGKLWVDCVITPIIILHLFIRAEREKEIDPCIYIPCNV